jgi:gamma-glutamylcyclotransferase (GGCT)/AIG2-like uncharacterized protein YtfP
VGDVIDHVFVYGTLRPGDVRWHFLAPFVVGAGRADSIVGDLYDTGNDYPAAVFALDGRDLGMQAGDTIPHVSHGVIRGATFRIDAVLVDDCLAVLDVEEDVEGGRYRRVVVHTTGGIEAWAYEYCDGYDLVPIASGDWFEHRPPPP